MSKQETTSIDQLLSAIREAVTKTKEHHSKVYGKMLEVNKQYNFEEQDWKVEETILSIDKILIGLETKYANIKERINRSSIKIYVFGRVSVGKSKVINAILGMEFFVSAAAHSTSCFVNVKKSSDSSNRIKYRGKEETFEDIEELIRNIESLSTAHDMDNKKKLETTEILELSIDLQDHEIFKDGIEIIDCPGAGNKKEITNCIKNQALDADIFIFIISNALTDQDKSFFSYQADASCSPDVFILVNQWDNTDNDTEKATENSKKSLTKDCKDFLKKFGITEMDEILERIYFISAAEALKVQINGNTDEIKHNEKAVERYESFEKFEEKLSNYINNHTENKHQRYKSEISKINQDILDKIEKFKKDILSNKNESLLETNDKIILELNNLDKKLRNNCDEKRKDFENKINKYINQLEESSDFSAVQLATNDVDMFRKSLLGDVEEFSKSQAREISTYLKNQELSKNKNTLFKKEKFVTKGKFSEVMSLQNQAVTQDSSDGTVTRVVQTLSMIPMPSLKIALGVMTLAAGATALFHYNDIEKQQQKKVSIIVEIKKWMNETKGNIDENINIIEKHNKENIGKMIKIFEEKKSLFQLYWKEMENIWKLQN